MKRLLVAAAFASSYTLASPAGPVEPVKQEAEFAPRKAYRECLNRSFAFLLIRGRGGRFRTLSPRTLSRPAAWRKGHWRRSRKSLCRSLRIA
jgi:hypothetical protein